MKNSEQKGCLSSVSCGEDDTFLHREHSLCNGCKRRVPIPLGTIAFLNSVSSCDRCNPIMRLPNENMLLRKLLWLRHDPAHSAGLYGDDGEMQCGACLIDFKRMPAAEIDARWQAAGLAKLAETFVPEDTRSKRDEETGFLFCDDCGGAGPTVTEGVCPYQSDVYNRDVPATLCPSCRHERAMDI